jgi:hypothetical protein
MSRIHAALGPQPAWLHAPFSRHSSMRSMRPTLVARWPACKGKKKSKVARMQETKKYAKTLQHLGFPRDSSTQYW